ncbi:siderophore-interacting protein [Cryobacterium melibiosiphilum]|uniref:Siderophore-interacting protein n=1 Tax=Cryobacterium melibiosiphilum TaxID=995039 RepID=A0A3A5MSE7_9MICO|nr:siderophore-interacting protein [Cryobacterium melibiosiphilum]RJT88896.1 siderophore-interacting protein [Cryobacterium melibiosiphilum]
MNLTDFPVRILVRSALTRRTLTVSGVRDLSPTLRRVTLTGADLDGFSAVGPDDHIKVFFPAAAGTAADVFARDFTPRAFRPAPVGAAEGSGGELDLDFALHGTDAPATGWAARAVVGDTLQIGGPRGSQLLPVGIRSAVLVADATALPAAARWLAALPNEVSVRVIVAGTDPAFAEYLAEARRPGVQIDSVPGDPLALVEAVQAQPIEDGTFVWAAGEAGLLIPLRRYLRGQLGLGRDQAQLSGYWKRGVENLDHHAPLDPTDPD